MEARPIEVTVISATDLKKVKKFGREQSCYAVAYVYPTQKLATSLDKNGGVSPIWNATLTLACYESHLHSPASKDYNLTVEIFSRSSFLGLNTLVGTAMLPLKDVMAAASQKEQEAQQAPFLATFQVRRPSGKAQGILNLSVRLGTKRSFSPYEDPVSSFQAGHAKGYAASGSAYPRPTTNKFASSSSTVSEDGIVTGYPANVAFPVAAPPFNPLGSMPARQPAQRTNYVRQNSIYSRLSLPKRHSSGGLRGKKRHSKVSMGLLILGGVLLAVILL